jgi:hypothetical protein
MARLKPIEKVVNWVVTLGAVVIGLVNAVHCGTLQL